MRPKKTKLPTLTFDLRKPVDARKFLAGYRTPDGQPVQCVHLENGKQVELAKATDAQAISFASQIYETLYDKGVGYYSQVELH